MTGKLVAYCEREEITFTRSRPYKKNDQCFVEQKNGQIVRRLVGYDRYEGLEAARALAELYEVIRLYVNFFQPSMRLISKSRQGAKTKRLYDAPRTPYDRVLEAEEVSTAVKAHLKRQYRELDPVELLETLRRPQDKLWAYGYNDLPSRRGGMPAEPEHPAAAVDLPAPTPAAKDESRTFHKTRRRHKKHKKHKPCVHWWRTYPDAFESVWSEGEAHLRHQPNLAATVLLRRLQAAHPGQYADDKLRTLQRRVRAWRLAQMRVPLSPQRTGDSLPEEHQIELTVHYPNRTANEPLRYDFE